MRKIIFALLVFVVAISLLSCDESDNSNVIKQDTQYIGTTENIDTTDKSQTNDIEENNETDGSNSQTDSAVWTPVL